jgi:PIN domain nuclease of toxin-antitoxin system
VRLLLDTHVLIWWDAGRRLSAAARAAIRDAEEVYVSAASAWEIAIKASLGKIVSSRSVAQATSECGFLQLPVTFAHAEQLMALPALHRDPFDRFLVAQAITEDLTVVTRDPAIARYRVAVIPA